MKHKALTGKIIEAALTVHKALGPGFLESVYESALCLELDASGLACERQKAVPILYRGQSIGEHRLDLFVESQIVVELKTVETFDRIHFAVVRSYMKAIAVDHALLINFAAMPMVVKRVFREPQVREKETEIPAFLLS